MQLMLASRSSLKGFADDNGRFETIIEALRLLPQYIFSGIGGSAADYTLSSMGISVHNFFVAYLIQFGICGGLAVNALLLSPLFEPNNRQWYLVVCVILGGMLLQTGTMCCMLYRCICFSCLKTEVSIIRDSSHDRR